MKSAVLILALALVSVAGAALGEEDMSTNVVQRNAAAELQRLHLLCKARPDMRTELTPQILELVGLLRSDDRCAQAAADGHPLAAGGVVKTLLPPTAYLVVPNIPTVAATLTSQPVVFEFREPGLIIDIRGTIRDDTAGDEAAGLLEAASVGVQIAFRQGKHHIVRSDTDEAFVLYSDLMVADGGRWSPLIRYVDSCDNVTLRWQNTRLAGGPTLRPSLTFGFFGLEDLAGVLAGV